MLQRFLKMAYRSLVRRKGYAVLNTGGLVVGITCTLLIFSYVAYERSYDSFHQDADRIYRVQDEEHNRESTVLCAAAMPGVAPAMKREFPEVENAFRIRKSEFLMGNDVRNVRFHEQDVYYADEALLDMFHLPLKEGDPKTALTGPDKVLLSATEAQKYFGHENPVGKVLNIYTWGRPKPLEVTGVFEDYPANSHLKLTILISYATYSQINGSLGQPDDALETSFDWTDFYTYVLLRKGADPAKLAAKLPAFIARHYNDLPDSKSQGDSYSLSLMPLRDIHLYSHYSEEAEANGDGRSVSFLFLIAFFIVGIAWINYINLATARSLERAREVGVRKVLGALRRELIRQFMLESLLLNLLALVVAITIALVTLPLFSRLTGRSLPSLFSLPVGYWAAFVSLFGVGTLLSGIYPALVLSRYQPVAVLKGAFKNAAGGQWLRKGLIIGQFAASIMLIAGTMIVQRQLHYMRSQQLGININQTLVLQGPRGLTDSSYQNMFQSFKGDALQVRGVKSFTASSAVMGQEILWSTTWQRLRSSSKQVVNLFHLGVDNDFLDSYGLKVLAGKPFSAGVNDGPRSVILNESAVRALGISSPQAAIGELITGGQHSMDSMQVTGVIADYHNEGLQKAIQPLVLIPHRDGHAYYSIKVQGEDPAAAIAAIKKIWDRYFPADPYDYFFLDEFFNRQYAEDQRFGEVFALFAALAIGIACFGLLGLSAYNVLQRTKEIGIRKVLGASVQSLLFALSRDFIALVAVSFVIAVPITAVAMNQWLQSFAYRAPVSGWIYAFAGLSAILVALLTVGFQALKAALANPIKSLRTE